MSDINIMSVRKMIDICFGDQDLNIVNFKLLQTILYLLARQQRMLERRVAVVFGQPLVPRTSSLSITEVKLKATVPKKKKKITKHAKGPSDDTGEARIKKSRPGESLKSTTEETTTSDKTFKAKGKPITTGKTLPKSKPDVTLAESTEDQVETSLSIKTTSKSTFDTTKSSTEKTKFSLDKTKLSRDKALSGKKHEDQDIIETAKKRFSTQEYHRILEIIEQQREKELRVVNQRADSREVAEKPPTPMASLDSMEVQYEKLLVVERVPIEEADRKIGHLQDEKVSKLDIVTQDQFNELRNSVKEIQKKFGIEDEAKVPQDVQLMDDLSRGRSLTDARAALLLSARLQNVERTLNLMEKVLTDLATKKGVKLKQEQDAKQNTYAVQYAQFNVETDTKLTYDTQKETSAKPNGENEMNLCLEEPFASFTGAENVLGEIPTPNNIDYEDLDEAMQELFQELLKSVGSVTNKAIAKADEAWRLANRLESKLDASLDIDNRMEDLERQVTEYTCKINALDTNLSSQMSNYQEQLTQMQHDLEGGLEAMAEALANPPGEIPGAAELNINFANLQIQFDNTSIRQNELQKSQAVLSVDVEALWKDVELLREVKADRDEVADALKDKAGLCELNGLVTQQQFDAVRGDLEKRIGASYDKFNNQELVWQKIIDDLYREINEKADCTQVSALHEDINVHLEKLRNKIKAMMDIVGEPRAAAISRRIFRDAACLSCSTPAHMNLEELTLPALAAFTTASTRPPVIGAEDTTRPNEGDRELCYPGKPIPHPIDPRAYICRRYCGGTTLGRAALSRGPAEMTVSSLRRETIVTGHGSDGKVYVMEEEEKEKNPCLPCNMQSQDANKENDNTETARYYVLPVLTSGERPTVDSISVTPPFFSDDD